MLVRAYANKVDFVQDPRADVLMRFFVIAESMFFRVSLHRYNRGNFILVYWRCVNKS